MQVLLGNNLMQVINNSIGININLHELRLGKAFSGMTPKAQVTKE